MNCPSALLLDPGHPRAAFYIPDLNKLLPFHLDMLKPHGGRPDTWVVVLAKPWTPALALGTYSEMRGRRNADSE